MAGDLGIERGNDFRGGRSFIREVAGVLEQFAGDGNTSLQSLGRPKSLHQPVLQGDFLDLIDDRVGLLQRHLKMAVLLQFAPGGLPPFLPIIANDIGHERVLDLIRRGFPAVAVQHQLHQIEMLRRRHLPQPFQVRGLAGKDVVFGNWPERLGGEGQVHRVAGLAVEVDHEAGKDGVHGLDAPKAPAPVHAKAGVGQLNQGFDVVPFQLARCRHLLEFFSHKLT